MSHVRCSYENTDIKLNMPVTSIEYKSEDKNVSVTCKDGSEIIIPYYNTESSRITNF